MNNVSLIGRLTTKPELKYLPNGSAITKFNIAVSRSLSKKQKTECVENGKPTADFPRIVVWGKQAETCCSYLDKGRLVGITGSVVTGNFETKTGETVYITEFKANNVKFLDYSKDNASTVNNESDISENEIVEDVPF